jgi:hypothetical protein
MARCGWEGKLEQWRRGTYLGVRADESVKNLKPLGRRLRFRKEAGWDWWRRRVGRNWPRKSLNLGSDTLAKGRRDGPMDAAP